MNISQNEWHECCTWQNDSLFWSENFNRTQIAFGAYLFLSQTKTSWNHVYNDFTQHFARRRKTDQKHVLLNCACVCVYQAVFGSGKTLWTTAPQSKRHARTSKGIWGLGQLGMFICYYKVGPHTVMALNTYKWAYSDIPNLSYRSYMSICNC